MSTDIATWAEEIGAAYPDIGLIVLFETPTPAGATHVDHVCLVMKDGAKVPWFAAGKGIEAVAYASVPGRDVRGGILADVRVRRPNLRLYMNFCDTRPLMFRYAGGEERVAGEEIADWRYRILYPPEGRVAPMDEFFYLWGAPDPACVEPTATARKDG